MKEYKPKSIGLEGGGPNVVPLGLSPSANTISVINIHESFNQF